MKFELSGVTMQTFRLLLGQPIAKLLPSVPESKEIPTVLSGDLGNQQESPKVLDPEGRRAAAGAQGQETGGTR